MTDSALRPNAVHRVDILLMPDFPLLSFSATVDAMRMANHASSGEYYAWRIVSIDGEPVTASSGTIVLADRHLDDPIDADTLLVVAGASIIGKQYKAVNQRLSQVARQGIRIGGLSLAAYLLADAGLLNGRRCTVHWENLEAFRERFPMLDATTDVFEIDGDRLTSAGGTASLDLMLAIISDDHGAQFAAQVADLFVHQGVRSNIDKQRMPLRIRVGSSHPKLLKAIELLESDGESAFSRDELAKEVGLSGRQLERLFRKHVGTTPRMYHLRHRLQRARRLLRQTSLPVIEVAIACGFTTASHFAKSYRDQFGITPSSDRNTHFSEGV